jgi:centrosomal protein CEP95
MLTKNYNEFKNSSSCLWQAQRNDDDDDDDLRSNPETTMRKKNKVKECLGEAYRRQKKLMEIMREDLAHLERLKDMKHKRMLENSVKAKERDERYRSAKVKRHLVEFRQEQRARMLKQATSEELIFKKLFMESIKLQKERMLEMKKYAKEKNEIYLRSQRDQIESIENAYKNKFNLLSEKMEAEKSEAIVREKAQHLILSKMNKSLKTKLESDIRDLQDQIYRDKDFLHWRQLDAENVKAKMVKADYITFGK